MTTFQDGPAKGKTLMLRRAARFLRVTQCGDNCDALDQLGDIPMPDEKLFAYEIVGRPGHCHINRRGGGGGFYPVAVYKFVDPQPSESEMLTEKAWGEWVNNKVAGEQKT